MTGNQMHMIIQIWKLLSLKNEFHFPILLSNIPLIYRRLFINLIFVM